MAERKALNHSELETKTLFLTLENTRLNMKSTMSGQDDILRCDWLSERALAGAILPACQYVLCTVRKDFPEAKTVAI